MSPRRDRVVKVRVSEAEQAAWVLLAKESFEGNLSDAIRSAMERSIGETAEWARQNLALGSQPSGNAIFTIGSSTARYVPGGDFVTTADGERVTVTAAPAPGLIEFISTNVGGAPLESDPGTVRTCPHGRLRESQWCPVCSR